MVSGRRPAIERGRSVSDPGPANERWLSPISLLEIALKKRIGKLPLSAPFGTLYPSSLVADDIHLLPLEPQHIEPLTTLPLHHKDPSIG